jgi:hypothetical protein
MTASSGIDISNGQLLINFGQSGKGGDATVTKGAPGATGCDGAAGAPATATGGKGADNNKRIFARGNVSGLENVTFSDLIAGDGGDGAASACDGGDGIACCAGGPGGPATATGGKGGAAALNVSGLPVNVGDALGGDGGEANATGGNGGNGGDCKFGDGGDGGAGGGATATAGDGGAASNTAGVAVGGDSQMATATGGDGGNGGDSGFGTPGAGGAAGSGTANAGAAGAATQAGSVFGADSKSGSAGSPGGKLGGTVLYCISFGFVQPPDGGDPIEPGVQKAPVFDEAGTTQVGTMDVEFVDIPGAQYLRGVGPDHVGLAGGQGAMDFEVSTLMLNNGTPGVIGGLRMAVLFANGVDEQHPLAVRALDGDGVEIGRQEFTSVPSSFDHPDEPSFFDALFNVEVSVATFRIEVPQVALVTPFRIYLLDP